MSLNEFTVEAAALEWFGELGYALGNGATFAAFRLAKPHLSSPAGDRPVGWQAGWLAAAGGWPDNWLAGLLAGRSVNRCDCGGVQSEVHPQQKDIIMSDTVSSRTSRTSRTSRMSRTS